MIVFPKTLSTVSCVFSVSFSFASGTFPGHNPGDYNIAPLPAITTAIYCISQYPSLGVRVSVSNKKKMQLNNVFGLDGQTVLVTGASSGLGIYFATLCCEAGAARVVLAARRRDRLEEAVARFRKRYPNTVSIAVTMDVTNVQSIKQAFDEAQKKCGGSIIDTVINNAGCARTVSALKMGEQDWDGVLNVNLRGAFFVASEAARRMVTASSPGTIVNIASMYGKRAEKHQANYCASKAGMLHASKVMAAELSAASLDE